MTQSTSEKVKHTPGPLQVGLVVVLAERDNHGAHGKKQVIELTDLFGETMAYIVHPEHVKLFAAAPEMLSALNAALLELLQTTPSEYTYEVLDRIEAAILKAGGQ